MSQTLVYLGRGDGQALGALGNDCDVWPVGEQRAYSDERAAAILDLNRNLDAPIIGVVPPPKPSRGKAAPAADAAPTPDASTDATTTDAPATDAPDKE